MSHVMTYHIGYDMADYTMASSYVWRREMITNMASYTYNGFVDDHYVASSWHTVRSPQSSLLFILDV